MVGELCGLSGGIGSEGLVGKDDGLTRVSESCLDFGSKYTLTLFLEACIREIVRFRASFTNLQLGFLEVFPLLILLSRTRSHNPSGWPLP